MRVTALVRPRVSWLIADSDLVLGPYSLITQGSVQVRDSANNLKVSLDNSGAINAGHNLELLTDIDTAGVRYMRIRRREDGFVAATFDSNGNASLSGSLTVAGRASISSPPASDNDALRMGDLFNTYMTEYTDTLTTSMTLSANTETTIISRSITINKRALVIAVFYGKITGGLTAVMNLIISDGTDILGASANAKSPTTVEHYVGVMGAKLYGPGTYTISVKGISVANSTTLSSGAVLRTIILGV